MNFESVYLQRIYIFNNTKYTLFNNRFNISKPNKYHMLIKILRKMEIRIKRVEKEIHNINHNIELLEINLDYIGTICNNLRIKMN